MTTLRTLGGCAFLVSGAAALTGVAIVGCAETAAPVAGTSAAGTSVAAAPVEAAKPVAVPEGAVLFSVPDMHCAFACAPKVQQTLAKIPGVEKVETNVEDQTATVFVADGFDASAALSALADAGYPSKKLSN